TTASRDPQAERAALDAFLAEPRNVMVAAIRSDGRPQMTPNWFYWDGARFYISTTRSRRKYGNMTRDARVQLALDDATGFRTVLIDGAAEIWEDLDRGLPYFKKIREKHGRPSTDDAPLKAGLEREGRVLLVITPDRPPEAWTRWGLAQ
ncbi:MAG: PPOX class F420-dependent oxidoreductase, partial [Dehalococcoidia bacterium]